MRRQENNNGITEGVIWKQLLIFFFPILLGTFFQQLYNTVDAVIVGNFVGKEALAAVGGPTSTLINLLVGFFVGISSGATVVTSQFFGALNVDDTSKAVHTAIALALLSGGVFLLLGEVFSPMALRAMGTPEEIMDYSVTYIRIFFSGILFSMIYNMGAAILRAIGDSRRPVYFLIVSCLVNVVLDLVLVVGLQMGVAGAALATIISQAISAILVLLVLVRTDQPYYHLNIREIRICLPILRALILIGIPAGLQSVLYSISNIIIQSSVNSFGTDVIAAWTAFGKIDGLFWMILGAFGISITTFAGQNFGAQKYGRIRKSVRICLVMATGTAVVLSSLLVLGGEYVYRLFTSDAAVIERGIEVLHLLVPFYFTYVCVEVLSGAVRGAGDAIIPMVITSLGICALRVTWVLVVVPMFPTLSTLVLSYPITWSVTSLLFIVYYLQGGWLRRAIARAGFPPEGAKSPSGE